MKSRFQNLFLMSSLMTLDVSMIGIGWWLAYQLRIGAEFLPALAPDRIEQYRNVVLWSLPIWIIIFALCRLYDREELLGGPQEYGNVVKGCLIGFTVLIVVSMFIKTPDLPRGWLGIGLLLVIVLVGLARFLARRFYYSLRPRGWLIQQVLIVGTNADARAIAYQLTPFSRTGIHVIGFVDDYLPIGTPVIRNLHVVASPSNLQSFARGRQIDQVILVSGSMTWESFNQFLRGITVSHEDKFAIKLAPGLYETLTTGVRVSYKNRVPLLTIERTPIAGIDALLKCCLDYGVSLIAFIVTLPLIVGIAVALRLLLERLPIQATEVLGRNGKNFKTYLFRAITPNSHRWTWGTPFGVFLFKTGLEKLPQLWNVLCGHMSLVGPRPMDSERAMQYETWLPNLLSLKPRMTGARASSAKNWITLEQEMRLEIHYARNYSIWLDLQIMFQTLIRMCRGERVLRSVETGPESQRIHVWSTSAFTIHH